MTLSGSATAADHAATETACSLACPACDGGSMQVFFEIARVPTFCNVLWETREDAIAAPAGSIRLGHCRDCGLIYNTAFDPTPMAYCPRYENALEYSSVFRDYAEQSAATLVDRYALDGKTVLDIGCGQGGFLRRLCRHPESRGLGFDPGFDPDRAGELPGNITIRAEMLPDALPQPPDFTCCRHVLEHIERPQPFLRQVHAVATGGSPMHVFFEVPNALWTVNHLGVWDIIYEHCTYYTADTLRLLFERCGFETLDVQETYGGQFLTIEARVGGATPDNEARDPMAAAGRWPLVREFASSFDTRVAEWRQRLENMASLGQRAAIWGAGSKGVTFLNVLNVPADLVPSVVDQNPHKHGRFVPGTGQIVVSPETLRDDPPSQIILMNPMYENEVVRQLQELGLEACLLTA